jgi:DNA-binding NarL/FixJ family response regulator
MPGEDVADGLGACARSATLAVALPEQLIAETLARLLGTQGLHVVGWYCGLAAVLEKLRRCRPRIVVVDPAVGGADDPASVLGQLRHASAETRIVVLCQEVDCDLAHAVVDADVSAVIPTSGHFNDVLRTIADVAEGRTSFPASVLAGLNAPRESHGLSRRQIEVLEQLAAGRSNHEIARDLFISPNTVKFHVRAIYDRMGVHNRVEAARLLEKLHHPH